MGGVFQSFTHYSTLRVGFSAVSTVLYRRNWDHRPCSKALELPLLAAGKDCTIVQSSRSTGPAKARASYFCFVLPPLNPKRGILDVSEQGPISVVSMGLYKT